MTDGPTFVYATYIATTPEALWRALTDESFTQRYWFATRIESDWRPGARVTFWRNDAISDTGEVLECTPPRRLSYTWHVEFDEVFRREKPSRVTFELEPMGAVVKLTVTHDQFEPGSKVYEAISSGWPLILANLKSLLETGSPLPLTSPEAAKAAEERAVARAKGDARTREAKR
jgi:uncharacterized protein YndB with AHSA1/START domain